MINNYVWSYLVVAGTSFLTFAGLYVFMPDRGIELYQEDNLVENIGAILLFSTFILGIIFSFKSKQHRLALLLISSIGLLGFLIEVGFGIRADFFDIPTIAGISKRDIHRLFSFTYEAILHVYNNQSVWLYLIIGGFASLGIFLTFKFSNLLKGLTNKGSYTQTFILASLFIVLFLAGTLFDLAKVYKTAFIELEELLELNSAIALFFCLLSLYKPRLKQINPPLPRIS